MHVYELIKGTIYHSECLSLISYIDRFELANKEYQDNLFKEKDYEKYWSSLEIKYDLKEPKLNYDKINFKLEKVFGKSSKIKLDTKTLNCYILTNRLLKRTKGNERDYLLFDRYYKVSEMDKKEFNELGERKNEKQLYKFK